MTTHPSFMSYDRRDQEEIWKQEERVRWSVQILMWVLILAGIVTILHLTVEPHIGIKVKKAEAAQIVDDKVLCSNPLTESREVQNYCVDLMERGL